ncbi:glucokinase [Mortierella claussenii]|nr:glucokinase [Mortierella claussenii]
MNKLFPSTLLPKDHSKWSDRQREVLQGIAQDFQLTIPKLEELTVHFVEQMRVGLSEHQSKDLAMIPTFVTGRPEGNERGSYLALDLGGTNLRVCLVTLMGNRRLESHQKAFKVSDHLQEADIKELMDFIAISIKEFIAYEHINSKICEHPSDSETLELGFTFSFPVTQTAIDGGRLLRWTKGFNCPGAVGNDIVKLLQDALDRNEVNVHVAALVNDTVGTLLAHAYAHSGTYLGAIFGTGTNGAYVEDARNIKTMTCNSNEMIINTEWGNYDKDKAFLPVTIFDNKLDRESINPGVHIFEKMISGMYLGEITRNVLLHLIDHRVLFEGSSSKKLNQHYGFETKFMSAIEEDESTSLIPTAQVLEQELGIYLNTQADREIVKFVCQLVGKRAARLSAMATAAVIRQGLEMGTLRDYGYPLRLSIYDEEVVDLNGELKTGSLSSSGHGRSNTNNGGLSVDPNLPAIHVGIDGSVFEHYPHFEERMHQGLAELLGPHSKDLIKLGIARDGSGAGAALAALIATKTVTNSR